MKNIQDNFSKNAATYAQFRPVYPDAMYDLIYGYVKQFYTAWDCATGNGQVAMRLADRFKQVIATDISAKQLEHASQKEHIIYKTERAEQTSFADDSFDLITIGQAMHWFDFDAFNKEAVRVGRNGGLIAAWSYNLLRIDDETNRLIDELYFNRVGPYWDKERKYVDDDYKHIPFPYEKIETPGFCIEVKWNKHELEGYLNTWSGVHHFVQKEGYSPVDSLMEDISATWGDDVQKRVYFPLTLKLGRIIK